MDWFSFVIIALATWRISSMLVDEDGPFDVFGRIRRSVGIKTHLEETEVPKQWKVVKDTPDNFFAEVLSCMWCCSLYVGAFWALLLFLLPPSLWFAIPFALSTCAIFMEKALENIDRSSV